MVKHLDQKDKNKEVDKVDFSIRRKKEQAAREQRAAMAPSTSPKDRVDGHMRQLAKEAASNISRRVLAVDLKITKIRNLTKSTAKMEDRRARTTRKTWARTKVDIRTRIMVAVA